VEPAGTCKLALIMTSIARKKSQLALGTVQLGLPYGAANSAGLPDEAEAIAIIRAAVDAGVTTIDTARAYGDSERRIGLACPSGASDVEIVTKLDPLTHVAADAPTSVALAAARASLATSRSLLRRERLDTLLLHRAHHRTDWNGAVWGLLRTERDTGAIGRIGVSVQTPLEAIAALDDADVNHLQLPFNILDGRWHAAGVVDRLATRPEVIVHVRSVFLQGLLAGAPLSRWPIITGLDPAMLIDQLKVLAVKFERDSIPDLTLAYVRAQKWIDATVIGLETRAQLSANLALFRKSMLTENEQEIIRMNLVLPPERLLDPARWPPDVTCPRAERLK
jgi:aryl-alcohol dehydrogenase-like predicted oxidoreductase